MGEGGRGIGCGLRARGGVVDTCRSKKTPRSLLKKRRGSKVGDHPRCTLVGTYIGKLLCGSAGAGSGYKTRTVIHLSAAARSQACMRARRPPSATRPKLTKKDSQPHGHAWGPHVFDLSLAKTTAAVAGLGKDSPS